MKRNLSIDYLRLVLSLLIVAIHVVLFNDINNYLSYFIVNGLSRIAVPLFLIINGYYFYESIKNGSHLLWIKKVLKLYIIWMLIYSFFWLDIKSLIKTVEVLFTGYYHLWYINALIISSIMTDLLKNKSSLLIIIGLFFYIISIYLQYEHNFNNIYMDFHRTFLMTLPYFLTGFFINKYKFKIQKKYLLLIIILTLPFALYEINFNFVHHGKMTDNMIWLIFLAAPLFLLLKSSEKPIEKRKNYNIAMYANGIFFVHIIFVNLISKYYISSSTFLMFISVILLSTITVYILMKADLGKRIF